MNRVRTPRALPGDARPHAGPWRPSPGSAWFIAAAWCAAFARGLALSGFVTTPAGGTPVTLPARWFVIPALLVPGALAPAVARSRWARRIASPRNVTSFQVLASFCRGGLVCLIPWVQDRGDLVAVSLFFGVANFPVAVMETWLRWSRPPGAITRSPLAAALAQLVIGAAGVLLGMETFRRSQGAVWFYTGAALYIASGVLASLGGARRAALDTTAPAGAALGGRDRPAIEDA